MTATNIHLSDEEKRRLELVEMDVRRAMREACKPFAEDAIKAHRHTKNRTLLATQLLKLLTVCSLLICIAGCGFKYEIYRYAPDRFERHDWQGVNEERYERAPK